MPRSTPVKEKNDIKCNNNIKLIKCNNKISKMNNENNKRIMKIH